MYRYTEGGVYIDDSVPDFVQVYDFGMDWVHKLEKVVRVPLLASMDAGHRGGVSVV